jgi:hypothetical protein
MIREFLEKQNQPTSGFVSLTLIDDASSRSKSSNS